MNKFSTFAVALAAAAMLSSAPAFAQDIAVKAPQAPEAPAIETPQAPKADLTQNLGDKAKDAVKEKAQEQIDKVKDSLQQKLPGADNAQKAVEINQESVTVETPSGAVQESETIITPAPQTK